MALYEPVNLTSGIDEAIVSTAISVPAFPIMLLVFVFLMILIGGSSNQKRRTGSADYPMWSVLAGITIMFLSLIMTLGTIGIIDSKTLAIVISVNILTAVWFFLSKQRGEL